MYLSGYAIETVYCIPDVADKYLEAADNGPLFVAEVVSVAYVMRFIVADVAPPANPPPFHPYELLVTAAD